MQFISISNSQFCVLIKNVTISFAALVHNVSSVTTDRPASASRVSWVILSLEDSAFQMSVHLRFHARNLVCALAVVANDVARE